MRLQNRRMIARVSFFLRMHDIYLFFFEIKILLKSIFNSFPYHFLFIDKLKYYIKNSKSCFSGILIMENCLEIQALQGESIEGDAF